MEEAQPDDAAQPEEGAEAEVPQLEQTVQTPARTLFQSQTRNKYREQMQQQRTISRLPPYLLRVSDLTEVFFAVCDLTEAAAIRGECQHWYI